MSVDSSFSDDLAYAPQSAARGSDSQARPTRGATTPLLLGVALLLVGAGVIAAIVTGANVVLSLLVGYSALASTIACLRTPAAAPQPVVTEPVALAPPVQDTTAAWQLVTTFTISDASRLLCNIEPGAAATQESIAWGRALVDAIKSGDLAIAAKSGAAPTAIDRERENPHYMTEVTREALRAWLDRKGSVPAFLRN